jgi:hypothetical protein
MLPSVTHVAGQHRPLTFLGRIVILVLIIPTYRILRNCLQSALSKAGCSFKSVDDKREKLGLSSGPAVPEATGEILDY